MKTLKQLLIELNACEDSIEWVQDKTIKQAVTECHRADWILWLAQKLDCDKRKLALCGGLCANTVLHLTTSESIINAVDTAIAYGQGNASNLELSAAWVTAWGAAWDAEWGAAWAAVRASGSAAAMAAAGASASAAAMAAAGDAAMDAALKEMAEIVRPLISDELIQKVNNLLQ